MTKERYWTQLASGNRFYTDNLDDNVYLLSDIATALSKQCRYNGNCKYFYSVAQHSVLASDMAPAEYALEALMHDASEAYIGDIIKPVKKAIPEIGQFEDRLHESIFKQFGLTWPMPAIVHEIDNRMLRTELDLLMPNADPVEWGYGDVKPYPQMLISHYDLWDWQAAEVIFLDTFKTLSNKRNKAAA